MGLVRNGTQNHQPDEENPYWVSFSDIMAGLLVIFILASMALVLQLRDKNEQVTEAIKELQKAEQVRRTIIEEIVSELKKSEIEVAISENHTVIRIPENVISFKQGKFEIPRSPLVRDNILKIGMAISRAIQTDERWRHLDTVFIEGHTDDLPCPTYLCPMGNWGLSAKRAISVWRYWGENLDAASNLDHLKNHSGEKLFSVSGYADTRPEESTINVPSTQENRSINRRIDVRLTIRRPKIGDLEVIKADL